MPYNPNLMDISSIVRELQQQRDAVNAAIAALEGTSRRAGRNEYKFKLNAAAESAGSVFMRSSVILLLLIMCQPSRLLAQTVLPVNQSRGRTVRVPCVVCASYMGGRYEEGSTPEMVAHLKEVTVDPKTVVQAKTAAPNSVGLPKPAVDPAAGTWKYKETDVIPGGTYHSTFSITIKDEGGAWTVNYHGEFPDGPVTDISTLERGTLALRRESFEHFAKPGRPWVPVAINLDFTGNKVTGAIKRSGPEEPFALNLGGPLFAGAAGADVTIGCLPLADGYSTTFRNFDIEVQKETPVQLKVVGMERVTVAAGTFDSWKVELTSTNGRSSYKGTVWIAKDSRTPVKTSEVQAFRRATTFTTTELVP